MNSKVNLNIQRWLFLSLFLLGMLSFSVFGILHKLDNVATHKVHERWQGSNDTEFKQFSLFFSPNEQIKSEDIHQFQLSIAKEMEGFGGKTASFSWIDSYFGKTKISLSAMERELSFEAFGIGGAYFYFHPYKLLKGSYMSENDISKNSVVLDELAAWNLFGSVDIVGKKVELLDETFTVSGVVKNMKGQEQEQGRIFLHYEVLEKSRTLPITCYQLVLPDPMEGYSEQMLLRYFNGENTEIVEYSHRFSFVQIFQNIFHWKERVISEKNIAYPHFENEARVLECKLAMQLKWMILLFFFAILSFAYYYIQLRNQQQRNRKGWWKNNGNHKPQKYLQKLRQKLLCSKKP